MLRLTWLGHATVVIDIDGVRLLTDPLLRRTAGPLRRIGPTPTPDQWHGTTTVLISHLHHDHAELATLRRLSEVTVVATPVNAAWLGRRQTLPVTTAPPATWTPIADGVEVWPVRADHHHRPMPHRPNEATGYLVRGPEHCIYFAGDTSLYDEMADLPTTAGRDIDVALLPIAGWGPRLSGGHMGPAQATRACVLIEPHAVMPIHHGTFHPLGHQLIGLGWMHLPVQVFAESLAEEAVECRLLDVPLGGSVELP